MTHHCLHTKEFIVGAAVGSLLGSVAALLVAPKTGKELCDDISDTCCTITDKTHDLANKGKCLAKDLGCQTHHWVNKAKCIVNGAAKTVKGWVSEEEEEDTTRELLIGGLIGGVLGATVGLLLAPKAGTDLRQDIADTYEDISERTQNFADNMTKRGKSFAKTTRSKANKWLDFAKNIVDDLTEEGSQLKGADWLTQVKGLVNNKRVSDVLDWAQLGCRVWHGLQSKRR